MVLAQRPPCNVQIQAHSQRCLLAWLPQHLGTRHQVPAHHVPTKTPWQTRGQCSLRTLQAVGTAQDQQHLQAVEEEEDMVAQDEQPPSSTTSSASSSGAVQYSVVNFYHLTDVEHPFRVSFQRRSPPRYCTAPVCRM